MFDGSIFKYYLDLYGIEYKMQNLYKQGEQYMLQDYIKGYDIEFRHQCKKLVSICDNVKMNNYRTTALSKTWYENGKNDGRLKGLKNNLTNYFNRYLECASARNGDIMWTCYSDYVKSVKGKGYTRVRALNEKERRYSAEKKKNIEQELSCFVPCNSRATNVYRSRWALAYCVNIYFNPMIRRFFTDHNEGRVEKGLNPVNPNDDLYALSCLIQWMFRSRIRDGKTISIYVPSTRMRQLLYLWMDNKI